MNTQQTTFMEFLNRQACLRFFFDYDGTLANFAPSPDILLPNLQLITLLSELTNSTGILTSIISGRRLADLQKLLPVPGMLLAGTYGIEAQLANGELFQRLSYEKIRPEIKKIIPLWEKLIQGRTDALLEDKGWAIALHGSRTSANVTAEVIGPAREIIQNLELPNDLHIVGDEFFLELLPTQAQKAATVKWVLNTFTPNGCLPIYFGDDKNDEEAFLPVLKAGGYAFRISAKQIRSQAQYQLTSPAEVLEWIQRFLQIRQHSV
ncbi:MAG: trehalose-phosphatase [Anaerolineaceae bacterium]|jgi:trehalose 6-phosphate phosphatase|nr:trehalose-phosphatase [Anaerolineaceae bacterium]